MSTLDRSSSAGHTSSLYRRYGGKRTNQQEICTAAKYMKRIHQHSLVNQFQEPIHKTLITYEQKIRNLKLANALQSVYIRKQQKKWAFHSLTTFQSKKNQHKRFNSHEHMREPKISQNARKLAQSSSYHQDDECELDQYQGQQIILQAVHNLLLYSKISQQNAFYRLLNPIRSSKEIKVSPKTKRMATMIYAFTKLYFYRAKKDAFTILLMKGTNGMMETKDQQILEKEDGSQIEKIVNKMDRTYEMRMIKYFMTWLRNSQKLKEVEEVMMRSQIKVGERIIKCSNQRMRSAYQIWKSIAMTNKREQQQIKAEQQKLLPLIFISINDTLKSVTDNLLIDQSTQKAKIQSLYRLSANIKDMIKSTFEQWNKTIKIENNAQVVLGLKKQNIAKLIIKNQGNRKMRVISIWKQRTQQSKAIQQIKRNLLRKVILTKLDNIARVFANLTQIPESHLP